MQTRDGRRLTAILASAALVGSFLSAVVAPAPAGAAVPLGFTDQLVTTVPRPTSISFTPDGRGVITTQTGTVRVLTAGGTLVTTPALTLGTRVCTNNERGAVGSAVDPQFATNHFVYVYWTFAKFGACGATGTNTPVNRLARYVLGDNNVIDPASELILLDNIPSPTGFHNSGDLEFGKDGFLYVTVGEGGQSPQARRMDLFAGKVLRITRDGAPAPGNPFMGADTDPCGVDGTNPGGQTCQEIYATGLRNPFRMAHNPNTPPGVVQAYVNDVGQNNFEEVNLLAPGADYGWNLREGPCVYGNPNSCGPPPAGLTNPIHSYSHTSTPCNAITGGAFVPNGVWGPAYDNDYLFADYVCGQILRLEPDGAGGFTKTELVTGLGQGQRRAPAVRPLPGRDGALLHRLRHSGPDPPADLHLRERAADRAAHRRPGLGRRATHRDPRRHRKLRPRGRPADLPLDLRRRSHRRDHLADDHPHLRSGRLHGEPAGPRRLRSDLQSRERLRQRRQLPTDGHDQHPGAGVGLERQPASDAQRLGGRSGAGVAPGLGADHGPCCCTTTTITCTRCCCRAATTSRSTSRRPKTSRPPRELRRGRPRGDRRRRAHQRGCS